MSDTLPPELETKIKDLERRNQQQTDQIASLRELARNLHHRYEQVWADLTELRKLARAHMEFCTPLAGICWPICCATRR